jgi:hypothetical protein
MYTDYGVLYWYLYLIAYSLLQIERELPIPASVLICSSLY